MSRENVIPSVNPLFFAALSGEFRQSNGRNEATTLGELLVETFEYGDLAAEERPTIYGGTSYVLDYYPSWSPELKATIVPHKLRSYAHLSNLILRLGEGATIDERLSVGEEAVEGDRRQHLRLSAPGQAHEVSMPLELGSNLVIARLAVTGAAQALFAKSK